MNAEFVPLDDFVRLRRGFDLPERKRRNGDVPILGSFGITGRHNTAKLPGPGVTVGRSGASIGVATYCRESYWPLNTALYVQNFKGNHPRFVYFVLDAIDFRQHNSGAAQPSLNRNYIGSIRVWRPSFRIQEAIARALGALDDLIENNRRRIEILEEMARLMYREWFVHFRFPGHEDVKLVDSDLGPIPEGWVVTPLGEHAELARRNVKPADAPDEEFEHYSIPAFDATRLPEVERGVDIRSGKYLLQNDGVLLSKLNPRFPRVWRVKPGSSPRRSICSTEFLVLEVGNWPNPFVYSVASDADFGARLAAMAGGTSTSHQRAKPKDVMNLPIVGPPSGLVTAFADKAGPMLDLADNLVLQNRVLAEARDLLLPRLISGELDVSDLDLDLEPVG